MSHCDDEVLRGRSSAMRAVDILRGIADLALVSFALVSEWVREKTTT
jgi:hypothetical protein